MEDTVSTHLLGPGDIVRPWQTADPGRLLLAQRRWTVLAPAEMAVLDARLGASMCRFPEVQAMIVDRLAEQMQRMAVAQAIGRLTGVDRRLLALFWHLAERWGRVAPQGVQVPLTLAHGVLADLVGARRPTVSTALGKLAASGELLRLTDGSWLLTGEPVGEPTGDAARIIRRAPAATRAAAPRASVDEHGRRRARARGRRVGVLDRRRLVLGQQRRRDDQRHDDQRERPPVGRRERVGHRPDDLRADVGRARRPRRRSPPPPPAPLTTAQLDAAMSAWRPRRR